MAVEQFPTFFQQESYSAEETRRAVTGFLPRNANAIGTVIGGVIGAGDLALTAPGSGLSVNVAAGECIVPGSTSFASTPSGYRLRNTATLNLSINTANPTNPRIDTVCATVTDAAYHGSDSAVFQVVAGTPSSGANLSNLTGAAALPDASLLIGYVLVPAAASNIITADILNAQAYVYWGPNIFNKRPASGAGAVTANSGDHIIVSSGSTPITLPSPFPNARVRVTNFGSGVPTVVHNASETIYAPGFGVSGINSVYIGSTMSWTFESDGTSWYVTSGQGAATSLFATGTAISGSLANGNSPYLTVAGTQSVSFTSGAGPLTIPTGFPNGLLGWSGNVLSSNQATLTYSSASKTVINLFLTVAGTGFTGSATVSFTAVGF